jgi:predicted RNase H-like HicB family nuclease
MRDFELTIVIERDEDGRFLAVCPALQGCYTEGESEEEARELITDAIRLHIESRLERGASRRRLDGRRGAVSAP